jgi:hypothetical protein
LLVGGQRQARGHHVDTLLADHGEEVHAVQPVRVRQGVEAARAELHRDGVEALVGACGGRKQRPHMGDAGA